MQIGNCVGAANHRSFIFFLISTVTSMLYVAIMVCSAFYIWLPLNHRLINPMLGPVNRELFFRVFKEEIIAFLRSTVLFLPARGLVFIFLLMVSVSLGFGLSILLWKQLSYIYSGKTYLSHLNTVGGEEMVEGDCQNFIRFFGCPHSASAYLPSHQNSRKSHRI